MTVPPIIVDKLWELYRKKPELFNPEVVKYQVAGKLHEFIGIMGFFVSVLLLLAIFATDDSINEDVIFSLILLGMFIGSLLYLWVILPMKKKLFVKRLLSWCGFNIMELDRLGFNYLEVYGYVICHIYSQEVMKEKKKREWELDRALRESLEVR